jgi:hypothetical protein
MDRHNQARRKPGLGLDIAFSSSWPDFQFGSISAVLGCLVAWSGSLMQASSPLALSVTFIQLELKSGGY